MLDYTEINGNSAQGSALLRKIEKDVRDSKVLRPLQNEIFSDLLSGAIDRDIKFSLDIKGNLSSSTLGTLSTANWDIHVFKKVFSLFGHDHGDVLILTDKTHRNNHLEPHIILCGENMKGWLDRGLAGYRLSGDKRTASENASIAIEKMIAPCIKYFDDLAHQPEFMNGERPNFYEVGREITRRMSPVGAEEFVKLAEKYRLNSVIQRDMGEYISLAKDRAEEQKKLDSSNGFYDLFGTENRTDSALSPFGKRSLMVIPSEDAKVVKLLESGEIKSGIEYRYPTLPSVRFRLFDNGTALFKSQGELIIARDKITPSLTND